MEIPFSEAMKGAAAKYWNSCFENAGSNSLFTYSNYNILCKPRSQFCQKKDKLEEGRHFTLDGKQVSLGCYALSGS